MAARLADFLSSAAVAVQAQQGDRLGGLLKFQYARKQDLVRELAGREALMRSAQRALGPPFRDIVVEHLLCCQLEAEGKFSDAFFRQKAAAEGVFNVMKKADDKTNWWIPAANAVLLQLRLVAYKADDEEKKARGGGGGPLGGEEAGGGASQGEHRHCKEAVTVLQRFFGDMVQSRAAPDVSKKMGCLNIVVHLFKVYFRMNNLRLCKNLVNSVEQPNFPPRHMLPKGEVVAYLFYRGRLLMFEEDYAKAEQVLGEALSMCLRAEMRNRRRILSFLIPVKLSLGKQPRPELLARFNLRQYAGLVQAVRRGDLKLFAQTMEQYQELFIRRGVFLVLEKLKTFVFRTLFRRVAVTYAALPGVDKPRHVPIRCFAAAMRLLAVDMDVDELECVIANLIYQRFIRAYIAHGRAVVFGPNGFPPIAEVLRGGASA